MHRLHTPFCILVTVLGGVSLAEEAVVPPALNEPPITVYDRQHWSYAPLARNEPPAVKNEAWVQNAVDRFIQARLEQEGLTPLPPADAATLIRRVSFDLTGLPPTPQEVAEFEQSNRTYGSYKTYIKLIDRLLASPHYGERHALHWLDLARFADSDGFEFDAARPQAWRYRDWVIDALNRDLPYDEFLRLQIAGDVLAPGDDAAAIATGFLLCGPDMPDVNLQDERRHTVLNEMTSTVGAALLGMQIGCAQCHDHKYDPISQADFYRLRAVFETAELFKHPTTGRVLQPAKNPPKESFLMVRGDFRRPGAKLDPAVPRVADAWKSSINDDGEGGRRAALARWLTRPEHPLTTRVIVNRLWQYHFGRGLVRTPSDFGQMGDTPTHPELLDWLATELPRRGWSLKEMHRLLLTSATYQQASRPRCANWTPEQSVAARESWTQSLAADPTNRLLARMHRLRLDGESIRDAMLVSAERLSSRRGGPGVMPPLPSELLNTLLKKQWEVSPDEEDHRRRSIYLFVRRNLRYPLFDVFDRPDTNASCPERNRSTTAPQALWQLNSEFSLTAARDLASYLLHASSDPREQLDLAYRRTLCRAPTDEESGAALAFLTQHTARLRDAENAPQQPAKEALAHCCLALFNLSEFIYLD